MRIDRVKLIAEMARRDIHAQELADKAGVSRSAVQSMRSGKSVWENTALHVANALGLSLADLKED
ncbi:MAG: helix-turn-helix domain-containing protein [Clostridiales bacterium]|nr:helix-turn-helix domain-containing protein [Clostridiales bacterium]